MRSGMAPGTAAVALALLALALAAPLNAQTPAASRAAVPLSLEQALGLAEDASESVEVARAGITRARGQVAQARSQRLPQVAGNLSYSRTLASPFSSFGGGAGADSTAGPPPGCTPAGGAFVPNPGLPLEQRVDSLEQALRCAGASAGNPFAGLSNVGFGSVNTWQYGFSASQNLFNGGSVAAQNRIAEAGRRVAEVTLGSQRAQLALDVTQAYFDAVLATRLVAIAESSLVQTEAVLRTTRLARQVGNQSEFELLRAQVTRDNQIPALLQQRNTRDLSVLRLKQLLDLSPRDSLVLTSELQDADALPPLRLTGGGVSEVSGVADPARADTATDRRAAVRQADEAVRVQEATLRATRG
ncbi:MAG TPA: TolC family protein, partial [Longimicrobium sp.]